MERTIHAPEKNHKRACLFGKTTLACTLFVFSVLLTLFLTWHVTALKLDGDASSEMVLAHHLAESGRLLSDDWYYSTELRVLNTQLVFAPLFRVFSDWHMVRFAGTLILQAILVSSFLYLARQCRMSRDAALLGAALLLLPLNVSYGRVVLYHVYYIPHLAIGFFVSGMYLSAYSHYEGKRKNRRAFVLRLVMLMALSFASGLGGIRQLAITYCPLIGCIMMQMLCAWKEISARRREFAARLAIAAAASAACCAGYCLSKTYLEALYNVNGSMGIQLEVIDPSNLKQLVYGYLHQFGWRTGIGDSPLMVLFSYAGVLAALWCTAYGIRGMMRTAQTQDEDEQSVAYRFFAVAALVMLAMFLFVKDYYWQSYRYWLPAFVWMIPVISIEWMKLPSSVRMLRPKHICMLAVLGVMLCNAGINGLYFKGFHRWFPQKYEGLIYNDPELVQHLEGAAQFLEDLGYTYGYATFWNANTVTEMTDGKVRMSDIQVYGDGTYVEQRKWLTLRSYDEIRADKVFVLVEEVEQDRYPNTPMFAGGQLVFEDQYFQIYHYDDPHAVQRAIAGCARQ